MSGPRTTILTTSFGVPTRRGQHQEPEEAEPSVPRASRAQPGHPLRTEDPHQDRRTAVDSGSEDATEAVRMAQKRINKAASKGRIHKNAVVGAPRARCAAKPSRPSSAQFHPLPTRPSAATASRARAARLDCAANRATEDFHHCAFRDGVCALEVEIRLRDRGVGLPDPVGSQMSRPAPRALRAGYSLTAPQCGDGIGRAPDPGIIEASETASPVVQHREDLRAGASAWAAAVPTP